MGATRRGGGAFQSWVKPEVDPPRVCARQRDSYLGRVHCPRMTHFSTTNCSIFYEWGTGLPEILLIGFIRVHSGYPWFKDIRAEKAYRRWPGGRSEQGKGGPKCCALWALGGVLRSHFPVFGLK